MLCVPQRELLRGPAANLVLRYLTSETDAARWEAHGLLPALTHIVKSPPSQLVGLALEAKHAGRSITYAGESPDTRP